MEKKKTLLHIYVLRSIYNIVSVCIISCNGRLFWDIPYLRQLSVFMLTTLKAISQPLLVRFPLRFEWSIK